MPATDKTGGPAFPNVPSDPDYTKWDEGMTLRDYFAARCIPVLMQLAAQERLEDEDMPGALAKDVIASQAYAIADAMITFRENTHEKVS